MTPNEKVIAVQRIQELEAYQERLIKMIPQVEGEQEKLEAEQTKLNREREMLAANRTTLLNQYKQNMQEISRISKRIRTS